jgi:hypothetical protein
MGDQEKERDNRCCRWCSGIEAHHAGGIGREEKEMVLKEGTCCRRWAGQACEKYLQIPTYLRWGRRLS